MGGKYVEGNAFYMSAKAHFVAHLLLAKIKNISPLWNAVVSMGGISGKTNSSSYQVAKLNALTYLKQHGKKCKDENKGFHSWSKEKWIEHGKESLLKKIGIFGPDANPKKAGSLGGKKAAELGLGIHTFEQRSSAGKKGGAIVGKSLGDYQSRLRRKCSTCGMIASPATIGAHQKAKNHYGWEPVL